MRRLFALIVLLAACRTPPLDFDGGLPPGSVADFAATPAAGDMAKRGTRDLAATPTSCCGQQGNPGNELGVGQYCQQSSDCTNKANICLAMFASQLTFCTMTCAMNGPANQCGSGATCQCGQGQCICAPGECTMPPPGC